MSKIPADDPRRRFIYEPPRNPDGTPFTPEQAAAWRAKAEIRRIERKKEQEERRLKREAQMQARREEKATDSSGQDETHQE
ncbi:MAG TPA: hypothetical protein PLQ56_00220 [Aggregatilineales bacterium]|nr:hypothetical protein [Aggregatilineales bacterium]